VVLDTVCDNCLHPAIIYFALNFLPATCAGVGAVVGIAVVVVIASVVITALILIIVVLLLKMRKYKRYVQNKV
jgi:Flp pilus assembly protein TadB